MILISTERFAEHQTPPGHPERPERAEVMDVVAAAWRAARRRGRGAARGDARAARARARRRRTCSGCRRPPGRPIALDPDTYTSPESYEIALLAAGAAVDAVERVMGGPHTRGARAGRGRPGHHAERDRAMGFCLFNNVAVAAAHARTLGARRVAIVDYDVHHGNGTQHIFERDPDVLYISTHQYPVLSGHRRGGRSRHRRRGRLHRQPAARSRARPTSDYRVVFDEVVLPGAAPVRAGPADGVGRLRRARARSARRHAADDRGVRAR